MTAQMTPRTTTLVQSDVGVHVARNPEQDLLAWKMAAHVEAERFLTEGYFGSRAEIDETYEPFSGRSHMIFAEHEGAPLAAARVIHHKETGGPNKTLEDFYDPASGLDLSPEGMQQLMQVDVERIADFATISAPQNRSERQVGINPIVRSGYAVGGVMASARSVGATHLVAGID